MPRLEDFENTPSLASKEDYEERLEHLQYRMLLIQQHMHQNGNRATLVFEGWDAGGKGGAIRRLTSPLDPRGVRVHPIGPPTDEEFARHYLWRFFTRMPQAGQLVVFDRSWYGRVMVERVKKLAKKAEWDRAYEELNYFEKLMTANGTPVIKFFLHITKKEQKKRFMQRQENPLKRWKLTEADWEAHEQYKKYYKAANDMLQRCDTDHAPWHVVAANRKWYARVRVLETVCDTLEKTFKVGTPQ